MRKTFVLLLLLLSLALLFACVRPSEETSSGVSSDEASSLSEASVGHIIELPASVPSAVESEPSPSASGESSVANSEPLFASSEPPTVSSESPVASNEPPVVSSEPPTVSDEPPVQPPSSKPHIVNGFLVYNYRAMEQFGGTAKGGQLTAELLNRFAAGCGELASIERAPLLDGRNMIMMLAPKKQTETKTKTERT